MKFIKNFISYEIDDILINFLHSNILFIMTPLKFTFELNFIYFSIYFK